MEAPKEQPAGDERFEPVDADDDATRGGIGPSGRWRKKLCECTEVMGCSTLCTMSFCCNIMLLGQVMSRMGLDWCGIPNPAKAAGTFSIVVIIYFSFWASYLMVFGVIFFPCMVFYLLAIHTRTRYEMRRYFQIPAEYCTCFNGAAEDCLVTTCCQCCATIQMARHTHDENRYPYKFDQPTGLPADAPPLYEDMSSDRM